MVQTNQTSFSVLQLRLPSTFLPLLSFIAPCCTWNPSNRLFGSCLFLMICFSCVCRKDISSGLSLLANSTLLPCVSQPYALRRLVVLTEFRLRHQHFAVGFFSIKYPHFLALVHYFIEDRLRVNSLLQITELVVDSSYLDD